ncbi:CYTH domain-containing protein [Roseomonas eburnea]|uniref:CYTH domain-containing protein n=1 Tax=Neoroseomonas eburnea TaxID=1346889 RepID=A0A9X9X9H6_9PROT|nr:CYTH domain-containing protein [Neoroseomonas eburnea]MBR0680362.1 CYTH domain-containing protein [Neoroseomonas eburnea]
MGIEIERRFLVLGDGWRAAVTRSRRLHQGYLAREEGVAVRLRVTDGGAVLTIKGPGHLARPEYEYAVPLAEAEEMLGTLCTGRRIFKTRHDVLHGGLVWEVDVFEGPLAGLVIAEVELDDVARVPDLPPWAGREVTADPRYSNAALASAAAPPRG